MRLGLLAALVGAGGFADTAAAAQTTAVAGPTLVFEPATGRVLAAEDPDRLWHPASLTKLMTAYLTFEAVHTGKLTWEQDLPLSTHARAQPATRIGLKAGIKLNVNQGVRGLIMRSANDFAVALAEAISGSEDAFIVHMNATAQRLGMSRTVFANPHGLPDAAQVTTARDLATLTTALVRDFPAHADVFSAPQVAIGRGVFGTHNDLLRTFAGADGMKTGFTCSSGYNVVASATRDGHRLVAVVLGALTRVARSERAAALLAAGFEQLRTPTPGMAATLAALAAAPTDAAAAEAAADLSRLTRTRKCGNSTREPKLPLVRANKTRKKAV